MSKLVQHITQYTNDAIALVDEQNAITHHQLKNDIDEIEKKLHQHLTENKKRIFLSGNNCSELLEFLLALLNTKHEIILIDPRSSVEEIQSILEETPCHFFFFLDDLLSSNFNAIASFSIREKQYHICEYSTEDCCVINSDLKLFFCTSGSTGKAKIFGFTDEQLLSQFKNIADYLGFTENDKSLCQLTITHGHGLMISIPILVNGGCVHYLAPQHCKADNVLQYVFKHRISLLSGVPYQYNMMLQSNLKEKNLLKSLRFCFCGSAPMSAHLATAFQEKFGIHLHQVYGISEIGPICFNLHQQEENKLSVGKVIPNIDYKIVDENGNENNEEGELVVRANFMTNAYLNNEEATTLTFKNGWIYTQDMVKTDEAKNIYIVGRKSNFINVAGYKIYPIEIEKALLSIDAIKEAVVFGVEDALKGQLIKAVVSTFYPITEDEIKQACKQHLANYKIPHIIQFEDALQQTAIHKVELSAYKK